MGIRKTFSAAMSSWDQDAEEDALGERTLAQDAPDPSRGEAGRLRAGRRPLPLHGRAGPTVHGTARAGVPPPSPVRPRRRPLGRERLSGVSGPQQLPGRGRLRPESHRPASPLRQPPGANSISIAVKTRPSRSSDLTRSGLRYWRAAALWRAAVRVGGAFARSAVQRRTASSKAARATL